MARGREARSALAVAGLALVLVVVASGARAAEDGEWCRLGLATGDSATGLGPKDFNAGYNGQVAPVKPGERLVFRAHFPRSRYMSLVLYDQYFMPIDSLPDFALKPLTGVNPFVAGTERRSAELGEFEVQVLMADPPAGERPANTLYAGTNSKGRPNRIVALAYRVYLPDRGLGWRDRHPLAVYGGVDAPLFRLERPDGASYCPGRLLTRLLGLKIISSTLKANLGVILHSDRMLKQAQSPPRWINEYSREQGREQDVYVGNEDTAYVSVPIASAFGELLVLRWKPARTPQETWTGAPFPERSAYDMRYWSLTFAYFDRTAIRDGTVLSEKTAADVDVPVLPDGTRQLVIGFNNIARPDAVAPEQWVGLKMTAGLIIMRNILVTPGYEGDFGLLPKGEIPPNWDRFTPGGVYCSGEEFERDPDLGLKRKIE